MEQFILLMRGALVRAGLERRELDGAVYFTGGRRDGPTLVLLHGVNDQAGTWAPIVRLLVEDFRLIVPDLAGHGESEPRNGAIDVPDIVRRLQRVLAAEAARPVTLVGNSMGAWMGLLLTLADSARVDRLVLEAGGGLDRPLDVPLTAATRADAERVLRAVHGSAAAALPWWAVDAVIARSAESPLLRLLRTPLAEHYVDGRLSEVNVPTTLIWGEEDGVVPRSYMESIRDGIRGSTLHIIERAAHIPHAQQPERFVECLRGI